MRSLEQLKADLARRKGNSTSTSTSSSGPEIADAGVQLSKERNEKQRVKVEENDMQMLKEVASGDAGATLLQMIKGSPNGPPLPSTANSNPGSGVQILQLAPALLQEPPFATTKLVAPQEPYGTEITWSRDQLLRWRLEDEFDDDRNEFPRTLMVVPCEDQEQQAASESTTLSIDGRHVYKELDLTRKAVATFKTHQDHMVSVKVLEEAFEEAFTFSSDEEDTPKHSLGFRKWFNRDLSSQDTTTLPTEAWVSTDAGSGDDTTDEDEAGSQKCLESPDSCQKTGARSVVHLHALLSQAAQQS